MVRGKLWMLVLPLLLAGCGRSALWGFDNGCPPNDPLCGERDASPADLGGDTDAIFGDGGDTDGIFGDGGDTDGIFGDGGNGDGGGGGDGALDGGGFGDGGGSGDGGGGNGDGGGGNGDGGGGNGDGGGGNGDGGGGNGDGGGGNGDGGAGDGGGGNTDGGGADLRHVDGGGKPDLVMCAGREVCGNHRDDDCNGLTDCEDKACQADPSCIDQRTENCTNGVDDDGNGLIDCKDPQCFGAPNCVTPGREICNNGIDDNDNGLVDCKDPDCFQSPVCQPTMGMEICNNGKDDNGDGLIDCADPQCVTYPACVSSACTSEFDFGVIQPHDSKSTWATSTVGATQSYATCAAPGGTARVGRFSLAAAADVKVDFTQAAGVAHVVSIYRAGTGQSCDQNVVYCLKAGQMSSATHTLQGLAAGNYWLIVQSYTGTQGAVTVTLSTSPSAKPEICNNGVDDDGNGLVDCADLACANAPNCVGSICNPDINLGAIVVNAPGKMASFDTHTSTNRYHPTCAGTSTGGDIVVRFTLKETAGILLQWSQMGDHVIGLFQTPPTGQACDAIQQSCYYPGGVSGGAVAWQARPPGDYLFIFKPVKAGLEGPMQITVSAYKNRQLEICSNGIDDDGNGLVDCADPACYGVGNCKAPLCMPDVDLGDFDYGTSQSVVLDVATSEDLYTTKCGKGNGKERVVRVNLLKPMALGFNCTETGDQVLQLDAQLNPLDVCDANLMVCADPKILPFGCNFAIPNLQAGRYNVIVEGFQAGTEGTVNLTLYGIQEKVLEICDNGIDDDMDGFVDCADKKCVTQPECLKYACRADDRLGTVPLDGSMVSSVVKTSNAGDDQIATPCVSAMGGQDAVVDFTLPAKADLTFEWAQVGNHALALYVDQNDLLACEANPLVDCHATMGAGTGMYTLKGLAQGKYHLVVDADAPGKEGGVVLQLFGTPSP